MPIEPTPFLEFPLRGSVPADEVLFLRDVDIVGAGSWRRHQLEDLQKKKRFVLQTYEHIIPDSVHAIYSAELLRTLQWLRPLKTVRGQDFDFVAEEKKIFQRIFPFTAMTLGVSATRMMDLYLAEMEWSSWLLQDHWRYFVGFLRSKFPQNKTLLELAHWEWVQAWIEVQPFEASGGESGIVEMNPSLQIVSLSEPNPVLSRDAGMYAFVYDSKKTTVVEKQLDAYEAQILDLLQEDRKYSVDQLIDMALINDSESGPLATELSAEQWRKKFSALADHAILIECQ